MTFEHLFHEVRRLSPNTWKEELCSLLGITNANLYKRIKGVTRLSAEELFSIARKYNLSLDDLWKFSSDKLAFTAPAMVKPIHSISDYLSRLGSEISRFENQTKMTVLYATSEIPVFHYMHFPTLASFKLAVWSQSVRHLNQSKSLDQIIKELCEDEQVQSVRVLLKEGYCRKTTVELWPASILDNTINQLKYHIWSGDIKEKNIIRDIIKDLGCLVDIFEQMAKKGSKLSEEDAPKNFSLYYNEIFHTNNTIILDQGDIGAVYLTHVSPNFIKSHDPQFFQHTKDWFNHMIESSERISGEGRKDRQRYFSILRRKLERLDIEINALLELR